MFVADTNVLVYAADESAPEHARCRELVEAWRRSPLPWYVTWGILYEFLRVSTHPQVFERPWRIERAWEFVSALLAAPGLGILLQTARHAEVAALTWNEVPGIRGNLLHDAGTAILMREHGIRRIYTRDADFHRFPFLEVVDPLAG
ncbi:MAG: PIN domain-containing protein [Gemmatimonadetes bacterium]|nr:PIN domain-containing protein [Gemmatimonadota bacterium]